MWLCEHDVDQFSLSLVEYYLLSLQRTLRAQPSIEPITDAPPSPKLMWNRNELEVRSSFPLILRIKSLLKSFNTRKVKGGFHCSEGWPSKGVWHNHWEFLKALLHLFGFSLVFINWKCDQLAEMVDPPTLQAILKLSIPIHPSQDSLIWTLKPSGKLKLDERLKVFLWRLASNALPTKLHHAQRTGVGDPLCPLCGNDEESYSHLFVQCPTRLRSDLCGLGYAGAFGLWY